MFFMFVDGPLSGRYEEICRTSDGDVFRYSAPNPESVSDITEIVEYRYRLFPSSGKAIFEGQDGQCYNVFTKDGVIPILTIKRPEKEI